MSHLRDMPVLRQLRGGRDPRAPKVASRAALEVLPGGRTSRVVAGASDRPRQLASVPLTERPKPDPSANPVVALLRERSCHTRHGGVTHASRAGGTSRRMAEARPSSVRTKAPLPKRPPPPPEPRSFLLPIAAVVIGAFALVMVPVMTAEPVEAAEPAPPPAPENATLTLRSTPEGATVKNGDEVLGTTPCDVELPVGEAVTLSIHKDGFATLSHEVTPEAAMEPVDLSLEALPFVLALQGVPEGATVTVGETTPSDLANVTLGTALEAPVTVTVQARGFQTFTAEVAADAFTNEDARRFHAVEVTMERRAARASRPAPAQMVEGLPTNPF